MNEVSIRIDRKSYASPPTLAIEGLHIEVSASEFVAILGPSGAGKSTLLNLLSRLDQDYEGSIVFDPDVHAKGADAKLAFVFQEPRLMPWLTAQQNITLVLDESASSVAAARALLADVELQGFEDAYPGQLSGGMQRRVALARAFAIEPSVLLLDEPFASLDAPGAQRLRELLMKLWERLKPTVIMVTHDLSEAISLADRLVFLSARPAKVVHAEPITLARPRDLRGDEVRALHAGLLDAQPELLAGVEGAIVQPSNVEHGVSDG
ncbi:MAG: ABC transporter ATP-binding protein [Gammaproteobacteria bacterium]|nr:ABC transporter ATP-binding protein [Gammaproteobacteria bacterium]